jgi:YHS domain-containing protein
MQWKWASVTKPISDLEGMFRALIEILLTIAVVMVARAVLTSILRGIARASSDAFGTPQASQRGSGAQQQQGASSVGELHKDPVCGTYVAESAAWKRQAGGQTFYYCSENCRQKHSLVAK